MPGSEAVTQDAIRSMANWSVRYFDHINFECIFPNCFTPIQEILKHNGYRVMVYAGIEDFSVCEACFNNGRILDYPDTFDEIQEEIELYYQHLQQ